MYLGQSDRIGSIAPGKQADLVVVKCAPQVHISDVENVKYVFKTAPPSTPKSESIPSTAPRHTNTSVPVSWTANGGYDLEPGFNHLSTTANSGASGVSIGNDNGQPVRPNGMSMMSQS